MGEAAYGVKVIRTVRIPMRDSVHLAANVVRPDADGVFPAILEYTPYHKGNPKSPPGRYRYFAQRGYVLVNCDVRGTGDSEGATTDVYQPEEIQDGHDAVEWIAAQAWCNGNVGMWGISYCGVVCWQVAMHRPPHLKAIIVRSGTDDVCTEWTFPGGSPRPYIYENYAPLMTAYNFAPPDPDLCGDRWADIWQHHLEHNVPWGIGFITHLRDGPYWRARSVRPDYGRVQCPTFVIGGWADWYATPLLRAFCSLGVPKKALIGPWSHMWPDDAIPGPRINGLHECEKWFDQWLKGIDTGVLDEPAVTVFVRTDAQPGPLRVVDEGFWRSEHEWPPARTAQTAMYLHSHGRLDSEPVTDTEAETDPFDYSPAVGYTAGRHGGGPFPPWGMPTDQRPDEAYSLTYTTEPLDRAVEVIGNPVAVLNVSSTAEVSALCVKLCDVSPDGTSAMVTKGYLNATHRNWHAPAPLDPGTVYELRIEMLSLAYVFRAGHRIRVDIAGADFPNAWPTPKRAVNSVYRGPKYPSHVVLPIVAEQSPRLPEPDLGPSAQPVPPRDGIPRPEYGVTHDPVNQTVTATYRTKIGAGLNTASFTVSTENPAEAIVKATYELVVSRPEWDVNVDVQCVTTSDLTTFHHIVEADVKVNGKPHFSRSWAVSVPRELF